MQPGYGSRPWIRVERVLLVAHWTWQASFSKRVAEFRSKLLCRRKMDDGDTKINGGHTSRPAFLDLLIFLISWFLGKITRGVGWDIGYRVLSDPWTSWLFSWDIRGLQKRIRVKESVFPSNSPFSTGPLENLGGFAGISVCCSSSGEGVSGESSSYSSSPWTLFVDTLEVGYWLTEGNLLYGYLRTFGWLVLWYIVLFRRGFGGE